MRSRPTRSRSPAFIAVFTSSWTCSRMLIALKRRGRGGCAVRLETRSAEDDRERRCGPGPGLADQLGAAAADDQSQRQAEHDGVIELADAGQEVRNEIERQGQIAQNDEEDGSPCPGNALIPRQAADEHRAVGDETRQRPRVLAAPRGDQGGDAQDVQPGGEEEQSPRPEGDLLGGKNAIHFDFDVFAPMYGVNRTNRSWELDALDLTQRHLQEPGPQLPEGGG